MNRILPPALYTVTVAVIVLTSWLLPSIEIMPRQYGRIGIIPFVGGLAITLYSSWLFKRFDTNIHTFEQPDRLGNTGPYRYSRNPMYLGFTLSIFGAAIIASNLWALILAGLFFMIIDRWYIPFEEAMMHEKFQDDYANYRSQVRRWL